MANEENNNAAEKKQIKEDKNKLKKEEKQQKQEIKKRAKEISKREAEIEAEEEKGNGVSSFIVTIVIIAVWLAILCLLIKLDVGGFGSEILTPILKDVPVINRILPGESAETETTDESAYGGYTSLKEAVDYINELETELEHAQTVNASDAEQLTALQAEVDRLEEFELMQTEFQRIKEQFYEEVVYSDKGPGEEAYQKYYESMDPTTAAALYKQVVEKEQTDAKIEDYVATYSSMKAKQAAAIFDTMTDNLDLVADILMAMDSDARADILGAMDSTTAAKLTKIMNPEG